MLKIIIEQKIFEKTEKINDELSAKLTLCSRIIKKNI